MRLSYGRFIFALITSIVACSASAQLRAIPPEAKRAELTHLSQNIVQLSDKQVRLAPGALIRDTNNIIVLPTMVPTKAPVRYLLDNQGMLSRAWVLSPQEASLDKPAPPKPAPVTPGTDKDKDADKDDSEK